MTSSSERRNLALAAAVAVAVLCLPCSAAATQPIDAAVAPLYVGQDMTVEGVVTAVQPDGYVVRLRLGEPPADLRVQLVLGMLSRFPPNPQAHYLGRRVRVYGKISEFRGTTEIIVRDPDRIARVDDDATADAEAAALRERVERLEQRLRVLEDADGAPLAE